MHIQELSLSTRQIADQKAFYCTTLGLPLLAETSASFTLQAGTTRLHFKETQQDTLYHIAFTIPRNMFSAAKDWMHKRVPLLFKNGEDEIFFAGLNARSFYFCDATGNILEYIVHYRLDQEREGGFGGQALLHVSEIGLPVEDVPAFAHLLYQQFALSPYGGSVSESFAFLGDIFGQLVVVKVGRPWLPTDSVQATIAPVALTIRGHGERLVPLAPYPYTLSVTAR